MENSIDAGATQIRVAVEDGGRKLISITDDGSGWMPRTWMPAFESHATSKIRQADDLQNISTLGFRGEALASIASIAQVRAVSRTRESDQAYCIEIDCGDKRPVSPCSGDFGTTIQVRDIFYRRRPGASSCGQPTPSWDTSVSSSYALRVGRTEVA